MESRISAADERRMVAAIERAATVASMDDKADRNSLLAKELTAGNVDGRFAKVASAAFNKRLTVLTFQNTEDARRWESFALADSDKVAGLMGAAGHSKTASEAPSRHVFRMGLASGGMIKAAKAEKPAKRRPRYEDTVSNDKLERHMLGMMEKLAAANTEMLAEVRSLEARIADEHAKVLDGLRKCSSFEFRTLCNYYGDRLESAMADYLPERRFVKTGAAADPGTPLCKLAGRLLDDIDSYIECNDLTSYFQDGLDEFSKSAARHAAAMRKTAASGGGGKNGGGASGSGYKDYDNGDLAEAALKTLGQTPFSAYDLMRETGEGMAARSLPYKTIKDIDILTSLIQPRESASPADIINSNFITTDRYHDRMLAWSDMSADPLLAMYPSKSVFLATQKVMDMHPSLETPENRETLRAYVAQLLAQNNRASTADIAALMSTIEHAGKAPAGSTLEAARAVDALDAVRKTHADLPTQDLKYMPIGKVFSDVVSKGRKKEKKEDDDNGGKSNGAGSKNKQQQQPVQGGNQAQQAPAKAQQAQVAP